MTVTLQLSRKAIDKFKTIYQEEFDEEISDDEAREMGTRLLSLLKLLLESDVSDSPDERSDGQPTD